MEERQLTGKKHQKSLRGETKRLLFDCPIFINTTSCPLASKKVFKSASVALDGISPTQMENKLAISSGEGLKRGKNAVLLGKKTPPPLQRMVFFRWLSSPKTRPKKN